MKLLISGSSGLLGGALHAMANERGYECVSLERANIDLRLDPIFITKLDKCFQDVDHFVHAAANTNVEKCEAEPSICYRDNWLLTELLANAANRNGVPMTFISSTGIYGSHKEIPWAEYDEVHPSTHHHKSKRLGELHVLARAPSNLVVRTGWLFGGRADAAKNFVAKRILEARASQDGFIQSNQQQRGSPTFVDDLATRVLKLIDLRASGIFNVVNTGSASRFEYVREIITLSRVKAHVRPVAAADFKRVAPVSDNEMAINWRADSMGLPPMRNWQEALSAYLATDEMKALTS